MEPLIAFRCDNGTYVLVPPPACLRWFENPSVEFLGAVDPASFDQAVALTIHKQVARWNSARISQEQFYFSWSHAQERAPMAPCPVIRDDDADQSIAAQ